LLGIDLKIKTIDVADFFRRSIKNNNGWRLIDGGSYPVIVVVVIVVAITRVEVDVVAFTIILTQEEHTP